MNCNLVEIYDRKSNEVIMKFVANKRSSVQKQVIKALENKGFNLWLQGKMTPTGNDIYWLARNKDYSNLFLDYREKEVDKKELTFDPKTYFYNDSIEKLKQRNKENVR